MMYKINYEKIIADRRMIDGVLWAYNCGELHTLRPDYIKRQNDARCARQYGVKMTKDECYKRLTMAQKNKKELKKIKLDLLKEIEQLKLMLRALEEG